MRKPEYKFGDLIFCRGKICKVIDVESLQSDYLLVSDNVDGVEFEICKDEIKEKLV